MDILGLCKNQGFHHLLTPNVSCFVIRCFDKGEPNDEQHQKNTPKASFETYGVLLTRKVYSSASSLCGLPFLGGYLQSPQKCLLASWW